MTVETSRRTSDPAHELDALIEEARRRARRRRVVTATVISAGLLALGATLLLGGGGGGSAGSAEEIDADLPAALVRDAGARTFSEKTLNIALQVTAPNDVRYEVSGLMAPHRGQFRVDITASTADNALGVSKVVGLNGEGIEGTVAEFDDGLFGTLDKLDGKRCWFNPHSEVGYFPGTISVEQSMRLTGSVLESLEAETADARGADTSYAVSLRQSASRPRSDFEDINWRVWGDRNLLNRVGGPIEVRTTQAGQVTGVTIPLTDYKPYKFFNDRVVVGDTPPNPTVPKLTIEASLSPAEQTLKLRPPSCNAME